MNGFIYNIYIVTMTELIVTFSSLITIIVGGGGILFYKQSKRIKNAEAQSAEMENQKRITDEWKNLYLTTKDEKEKIDNELNKLRNTYHECLNLEATHRVLITKLKWSRCEVNNCINRIPPRDFTKLTEDAEELHDDIRDDQQYDHLKLNTNVL